MSSLRAIATIIVLACAGASSAVRAANHWAGRCFFWNLTNAKPLNHAAADADIAGRARTPIRVDGCRLSSGRAGKTGVAGDGLAIAPSGARDLR